MASRYTTLVIAMYMQMTEGSEIVQCIKKYITIQNSYVTHQIKLRDQKKKQTKKPPKIKQKNPMKTSYVTLTCN